MPTWDKGTVDGIPVSYKLTLEVPFRFYNASIEENKAEKEVFTIVEKRAEFPGGEQALYQFIAKSINYPQLAIENGISGRIMVQFVVEKDGSISNVKIPEQHRKLGFGLEEEAIRVVKLMPKWKPGTQSGKPVRIKYILPIVFNLE